MDLIQIWAIGLAYDPSLSQVNTIYQELLDEGFFFFFIPSSLEIFIFYLKKTTLGFEFPLRDLSVVGLISDKPQISVNFYLFIYLI